MSPLASKSLLQAVARAGDASSPSASAATSSCRTTAATTWKQSPVPVSSDLTAVFFVDDRKGWAVGHDGVILRERRRRRHLDAAARRPRANARARRRPRRASRGAGVGGARRCSRKRSATVAQGADKPFLDVWFADEATATRSAPTTSSSAPTTAARRGTPWFDRTDNPKFLNLYAIRPAGGRAVTSPARAGLVLKLDPPRSVSAPSTCRTTGTLLRRRRRRQRRARRSGCAATRSAATTRARRGPRSTPACRPRSSPATSRWPTAASLLADVERARQPHHRRRTHVRSRLRSRRP